MMILYIATSKNLAGWAADVGLTKHVYKLGVAEGSADDAVKALNDGGFASESDWRLLKQQEVDGLEEAAAIERMAKKEKMIDPNYYPKIRGAVGIFKIKIGNVANHLLVKRALAGDEEKVDKVKTADIAAYLIQNAQHRALPPPIQQSTVRSHGNPRGLRPFKFQKRTGMAP